MEALLLVPVAADGAAVGFQRSAPRRDRIECGQIPGTMRVMTAAVVMWVPVVVAGPGVFEELGQAAIVVGMDMRAIATCVLVVQEAGARDRDVEREQSDDGRDEPSIVHPSANQARPTSNTAPARNTTSGCSHLAVSTRDGRGLDWWLRRRS